MNEELVKYKTVKLALKKGIDFRNKEFSTCMTKGKAGIYHTYITQSLLQRWLREVHKIEITVDTIYNEEDTEVEHYELMVFTNNKSKIDELLDRLSGSLDKYKTYELALEEGLQIALNLIK